MTDHEVLQKVDIYVGEYYNITKQIGEGYNFLYIDPPYRPLSGSACFIEYTHKVFDDGEQEKLMQNLESDLWKSIYTKEKGLMKNPTKFWVQEALKTQKEQVVRNGNELVENLIGGKNKKGLYDDVIDILRENIDKEGLQKIDDIFKQASKNLKKANNSECLEYFDKKRDLIVGVAPTDIVSQIFGVGLCGWAVGSAQKDERLQRALTTGLPVATGLASSLIFSALLYSGGVGLLAGAAVSGITSVGCYLINKYVFGNKDSEIDAEEQNKQTNNKQNLQEAVNV